jgi:hypothetical protein
VGFNFRSGKKKQVLWAAVKMLKIGTEGVISKKLESIP